MCAWCLHCVRHRPLYHRRLCISLWLFFLSHYGYEAIRSLLPLLTRALKALYYVFKPVLLFQRLFMGPDLTPLTRRTFLLLSLNGPACFVATVASEGERMLFFLRGDLERPPLSRRCRKGKFYLKKVADVDVNECFHWDYNDRSDLLSVVWFSRRSWSARRMLPRKAQGKESESATSMCFWYVGAIILIWPRLNQMSNLPNYKITVLAGTVTRVNVSLIFLLPEDIWFFSTVFYLSSPCLSSGTDLRFNSISSAAEHPGNDLFLQGNRGAMCSWWRGSSLPSATVW